MTYSGKSRNTITAITTQPVALQRIESAFLALLLLIVYGIFDFAWWYLAVFFLMPDLSIIAYAKDNQFGAQIYNLAHSYTVPLLMAIIGAGLGINVFIVIALIWTIHIAIDRACGYGFKYRTSFRHNHLSWK